MFISIEWFNGQHPQFNVAVSSAEGREAFITVKGCRLVDGSKGTFVSWPSTKNESTGKYWQHVWASEKFATAVMERAVATKPNVPAARQKDERYRAGMDEDSDVPF